MFRLVVLACLLSFVTSTDSSAHINGVLSKPLQEKVGIAPYTRIIDEKQLKCLTDNVYFEARNQKDVGMKAVAFTTLNRLQHIKFPSTICEVVYQRNEYKCQFSWTCYKRQRVTDLYNYRRAKKIAKTVLINYEYMYDVTKGATFFHRNDVRPSWAKTRKRTAIIGKHIFYSL